MKRTSCVPEAICYFAFLAVLKAGQASLAWSQSLLTGSSSLSAAESGSYDKGSHPRSNRDFPRAGWPPTMAPSGALYAGAEVCARCHRSEAATQSMTPMARALAPAAESAVLRQHPRLTFRKGRYNYEIVTHGNTSTFTVSDGVDTISVPVLWAFGYGLKGVAQTYVFQYGGHYFESQVSYYDGIQGLAITMGHIQPPAFLEAALGYWLSKPALKMCLACHATAAVNLDQRLQLDQMMPGIGCQGCHGPGTRHIAAVNTGHLKDLRIFNPGRLPPHGIMKFCGSCHRTASQEKVLGVRGVANVRFQGYRLARSRCYDPEDPRIACTACHDPHRVLERNLASYDGKCLACHRRRDASRGQSPLPLAPACPVAHGHCVTCHMSKVRIPGVNYAFTDHWIRVVEPGEPYPD